MEEATSTVIQKIATAEAVSEMFSEWPESMSPEEVLAMYARHDGMHESNNGIIVSLEYQKIAHAEFIGLIHFAIQSKCEALRKFLAMIRVGAEHFAGQGVSLDEIDYEKCLDYGYAQQL